MKPSMLMTALEDLYALNIAAFIWGAAGIGESEIVRQFARKKREERVAAAGLSGTAREEALAAPPEDGRYFGFIDYRLYLREQVDVMGLPDARNGVTFSISPPNCRMTRNGWGWCFDEFCIASPSQQSPGMQIFLDRQCGAFKLPRNAWLVAASNRQSDRGLFHRLADPMADRVCHLTLEVDLTDWRAWAYKADIAPEVIAFLGQREALLHKYDPQRAWVAPTSPRGWADVSKIIKRGSVVEAELYAGRVGDAAAGELGAFLKLVRKMVSPDEVIKNPKTAEVPKEPDVLYALAEALARRSAQGRDVWGAVMTYAQRMPREYAQCLVSAATKITPALCNTAEFIAWAEKNG